LENLRFHSEEEAGCFFKTTSGTRRYYVNDAFGTAHRAHASTTIIAQFLKTKMFRIIIG
jgi:phosphoglycerate kinase